MKQAWIFETVQYTQRTLVYVPDDYNEQKVINDYKEGILEVVDTDAMWEGCESLCDYKVEIEDYL